jgi:DNA-binding transcriptional regulator YhcF (GntR family)
MNNGYIKIYRKMLENPIIMKDSDHLAVWVYLLMEATHKEIDVMFGKERKKLVAGQLITGRNKIANELRVNSSKIQRILDEFEKDGQIEQQANNKCRLITIPKWGEYQKSEQQVNNKRTTSEQQVNTIQEYKECKNNKNERNNNNIYVQEFCDLWAIYPKKQGRTDAEKKYCKYRNEGVTYNEVLEGLKKYINYINRKGIENKYIKNGSTWFNQKCWEDEYNVEETRDPQLEILKGVFNGDIKIN